MHPARPMICRMYPAIAMYACGRMDQKPDECPALAVISGQEDHSGQAAASGYDHLRSLVEAMQSQGIPVFLNSCEDGTIELKLSRIFC
ncbi:MAG: hypothetical protein GKC10_04500 [Methanosarcinales archaeon]|nr:hypothetical protein [Methanosarcinales archaeon]